MRINKTPFLRPRLLQKVLLIAISSAALAATGCSRNKPAEGSSPAANQGGQPGAAKGATGPGRPAGAAGTSSMTITTTQVKSLDIVRSVPATGSIHPWQEVIVSAEVGGYRVAEVLVDVGTRVSKGQPLVRLSGDMLQAYLDSKRAALRSAEAALVNASAALRRG